MKLMKPHPKLTSGYFTTFRISSEEFPGGHVKLQEFSRLLKI